MNYINPDLEFTIEKESDFQNVRLPTLEIWSTNEKIRHQKFARLTNEQNK